MVFPAETASIRECLQAVEAGASNVALGVDGDGRLTGLVTDGDLRRALLAGATLESQAQAYIRRQPATVRPRDSRSSVIDLMVSLGISQVPIVDESGVLLGVHLLRGVLGRTPRPNAALILAGGQGQRLRPLTEQVPKPMLKVAGRPILERVVTHLVGFGIRSVVLAVGYRADVIEEHFGDGSAFGCTITYLREDPDLPRGTAGPIADLVGWALVQESPLLVVNGDLVTQFDVAALLDHHHGAGADMTVGIATYRHNVPYGVIELTSDGVVKAMSEKPEWREYVSAGIYVVDGRVASYVPTEGFFPMNDLIQRAIAEDHRVVGWLCDQDWIDVGMPQDLASARGFKP